MKKIIVASSKGGVGKTTVALGIASALCEKGKKVLLCDLDFENRCLDLFMGLSDIPLYNIYDVATGRAEPKKAVIKNDKGLSFIAAPVGITFGGTGEKSISAERLAETLEKVTEYADADFVICDTAAGKAVPEALAKSFANYAIVVASHQPASQRGAEKMAGILSEGGVDCRLVVSSFEFKETLRENRTGILDIIDFSGVQLLGVVPYDRALMLSHEKGVVVPKKCEASAAFANIAARLCGANIPLFYGIKSIKKNRIV